MNGSSSAMVNSAIWLAPLGYTLIHETPTSSISWSDCAAANNVINFGDDVATSGAAADPSGQSAAIVIPRGTGLKFFH
jgi:hypothetical protein